MYFVLISFYYNHIKNQIHSPVLVISGDSYNQLTEDIVVLAITSKLKDFLKDFDYSVMIESKDLIEAELKVTSEISADKIYTLSKNIIRKKFVQVNARILKYVRKKITELIV